ncbi:DUF1289 domain-containing protein [Steroidobacter sp.]|uniref:DUF1289 domain-containing protein n=1 Tax=Steroidobacter sp. TaxID=1978227 RepID=UPI0039C920F8
MTFPPHLRPPVASPCIKVCVLDARNVCVGCGRTIDEITQWSRLTEEQQRLVVDRARQRREAAS